MGTSFLGSSIQPLDATRGISIFAGVLAVTTGIRAILSPTASAETFGIHSMVSDHAIASNPFITITGGRNVASGLSLIGCACFGSDRVLGIVLMTSVITGGIDGWVVLRHAGPIDEGKIGYEQKGQRDRVKAARRAAYGHWVLTSAFSILGLWLVLNSES